MTSTGKAAEAGVAYIDAGKTLRQAGHLMRELGVGALGVRGKNGKIQGTISSDMVVRRIAAGGDPKTVTVGELAAVPPYIPSRSRETGARGTGQGPDPGDDHIHWQGAGPWHWAAPDGATAGSDVERKIPGLVALPVRAASGLPPVPLASVA